MVLLVFYAVALGMVMLVVRDPLTVADLYLTVVLVAVVFVLLEIKPSWDKWTCC